MVAVQLLKAEMIIDGVWVAEKDLPDLLGIKDIWKKQ